LALDNPTLAFLPAFLAAFFEGQHFDACQVWHSFSLVHIASIVRGMQP